MELILPDGTVYGDASISCVGGDKWRVVKSSRGPLDREAVRSANVAKSAAAGTVGASNALALDWQAAKWEGLIARNQYMDADLKRFYVEKAQDCRREAARLRGEPVEPQPVEPFSKGRSGVVVGVR